jgi:hypothetical protein
VETEKLGNIMYPLSIYCEVALASMLIDADPFLVLRYMVVVIGVLLPIYVFFSVSELLSSWKAGAFSAFFIAFLLPAEITHFLETGTWSNIFCDVMIFAYLFLFFRTIKTKSLRGAAFLSLFTLFFILIHFIAFAIVFFTMIFAAISILKFKDLKRNLFLTAAVST